MYGVQLELFHKPCSWQQGLTPTQETRRVKKEEAIRAFENEKILVIVPETFAAAYAYSRGTGWCIGAGGYANTFQIYRKRGPLYIIKIKATNKRYLWSFDAAHGLHDENCLPHDMMQLCRDYPDLREWFIQVLLQGCFKTYDETDLKIHLFSLGAINY